MPTGDSIRAVKRHQSRQSLLADSVRETRLRIQLKKRRRLNEDAELPSVDPYEGLGLTFDNEGLAIPHENEDLFGAESDFANPFVDTQNGSSTDKIPLDARSESMAMSIDTPEWISTAGNSPTSQNSDDWPEEHRSWSSGYPSTTADSVATSRAWGSAGDSYASPRRWNSIEEISKHAREISWDRPIDEYSDTEVREMKRAAEYLQALTLEEDAFRIFALILKRYQSTSKERYEVLRSATIACARSARGKTYRGIAIRLISQKLDEAQGSTSDAERFLYRMALSKLHVRDGDDAAAAEQEHCARGYGDTKAILAQLPSESRLLDLLIFDGLMRCLYKDDGNKWNFQQDDDLSLDQAELFELILCRIPGPFELWDGHLQNPCLRSCLEWCNREMKNTSAIGRIWRDIVPSKHKFLEWSQTISVFSYFWELWQDQESSEAEGSLPIWMTDTESRFGTSATELLMTLCWMVVMYTDDVRRLESRSQLISKLQLISTRLMQMSDLELAALFLATFRQRNDLAQYSKGRSAFQKIARTHIMSSLHRMLGIVLPDQKSGINTPIVESSNARATFGIVAATILPTLASSLRSSELSSLRALRDRIKRDVHSTVTAAAALPSAVFRNGSLNNRSLLSMSELSQAFRSSLSLSSIRRPSASRG